MASIENPAGNPTKPMNGINGKEAADLPSGSTSSAWAVELLKALVVSIEAGQLNATAAIVLLADCPQDVEEPWHCSRYSVNVSRERELSLLEMSTHAALSDWIGKG